MHASNLRPARRSFAVPGPCAWDRCLNLSMGFAAKVLLSLSIFSIHCVSHFPRASRQLGRYANFQQVVGRGSRDSDFGG